MKVILALFCILSAYEVFAQGDAPPFTQGQKQTTGDVATRIRVPNNQSTKTSTSQALIETGNLNLLVNPGFEHLTYTTGWTTTGTTGTLSAETSTIISGNKALKVVTSAQDIAITNDSTLYAAQLARMQGYVQMACSNTAPSVSLCARGAGTTSTTDCVTLDTTGEWEQYEIPVVLSATSNGVSVAATSTTGTTICDEAYVGLISGKTPEVSQAQLALDSYFAGTTSCTWSRTSTTVGAFSSTAACPGPTIVSESVCDFQTTDADLPRVTGNSCPAGKYKVKFIVLQNTGASAFAAFAINDGTTTCQAQGGNSDNTNSSTTTVECSFEYTSAANRTFELYGATSSSSLTIQNGSTSPNIATRVIVEYYPPASKIYSQPNNLGSEISFTGSGSWVTNTTYTKATYKLLPDGWVEYQYAWSTSGAPTSATLSLNLPSGHTIDTARLVQGNVSGHLSSSGVLNDSSTNFYQIRAVFAASALTSVVVTPFGAAAAYAVGNNSVTQAIPFTWGAEDTGQVIFRLPITIWQGSQITGTFKEVMTVPGVSKPVQFGFRSSAACTTGSCPGTFYGDTIGTGSVVFTSTGSYTTTIPAGKCAATPWCEGGLQAFTSTQFRCNIFPSSATSISTTCFNNTPAAVNEGFHFMCWCQEP